MSNQIKTSIISHANCTDGMMAAFLFYAYYRLVNKLDEVEFIFCQYNQPVPQINGQNVIIVDFSFTKEQMESQQFSNKTVLTLDHHESAALGYGGWGNYSTVCGNGCNHKTKFQKDKSGAGLAWDYIGYDLTSEFKSSLFSTREREYYVGHLMYLKDRVQDRDLWRYECDDTRAVYEVLNSVPKTLEAWWDLIIDTPEHVFTKMVDEADIRVQMRLELAAEYASKATIVPYKDKTIAIVNCASNFASEVGDILGKEHAFAVMFIVSPKDKIVIASLRSNSETGEDVSVIAKSFGGGGHVNAAGFSFNYEKEPTKLFSLLDGSIFKQEEEFVHFRTEVKSVQTIIKLAEFYKPWFQENGSTEGVHSISGDELKMMDNIREFLMHEHLKTFSIMQVMEMLLNDTFMRESIGSLVS